MALNEKLALIISANPDQAVKAFEKVGVASDKHLGRAEDKTQRAQLAMASYGAKAVAVGAVAGVALYGMANAASDLAESQNKANVVFGQGTAAVTKFAESAAEGAGLSERAALDAASGFGTLFTNLGKTESEAAKMSLEMTSLASDMASFSNTSTDEAVLALGAALRGENEPIRRYGVLLSDSVLKQRALNDELIDSATGTLPPNIRAQAAYAEILAQTSKQQGDFGRTAEGAANKQRILQAQLENLKASVGTGVLPLFTTLLGGISGLAKGFDSLPAPVREGVGEVAAFGATLAVTGGSISLVASQVLKMKDSFLAASGTAGALGSGLSPLGLASLGLTAALTLGALAFKKHGEEQAKAEQISKSYARSIAADNGEVGSTTQAAAVGLLRQSGALEKLEAAGIGAIETQAAFAEVTGASDAALGGLIAQSKNFASTQGDVDARIADTVELLNGTGNKFDAFTAKILSSDLVRTDEGRKVAQVILEQRDAIIEQIAVAEKSAGVEKLTAKETAAVTQAVIENKDATEALENARRETIDTTLSLIDAELGLRISQLGIQDQIAGVTDAEQKLAEARAAGVPEDIAAAERDLEQSYLSVQKAAIGLAEEQVKLAEQQAEAKGETLDAAEAQRIHHDALVSVANQVAPGTPLRAGLDGLIGQVGYISAHDRLQIIVNADTSAATASLNTLGNLAQRIFNIGQFGQLNSFVLNLPQRAAGGPVTGNSPYIVGERGPELFVPQQSGSIIPNGAGLGGGGSVNIYISAMDVSTGADAAVNMLSEYCRNNGALPSTIKVA